MTFAHISQIEQLRQQIFARTNRCIAINNRAEVIRSAIPWMSDSDLTVAGQELAELRKELIENEIYIQKARKWISDFYKNPIREKVA